MFIELICVQYSIEMHFLSCSKLVECCLRMFRVDVQVFACLRSTLRETPQPPRVEAPPAARGQYGLISGHNEQYMNTSKAIVMLMHI